MHELGMCEAIVEATLQAAEGKPVESVRVRVGGHPVDADVIDQGFRLAAQGTLAADARIEVIVEPLSLTCNSCGRRYPVPDALAMVACRACGGVDVEVDGHDEVAVEAISLREREGDFA